jgi:thiamine pyrophosphokinase
MHVVIFANGTIDNPESARHYLAPCDLVLCADGGTRHAQALGVRPDVVVGDMDSLDQDLRGALEAVGTEFLAFPATKDETDLELALLYAVERGATEITVLGAWGGRIDHELGNVMLLAHPGLAGIAVRMVSGEQEIVLIRHELTLHGDPGDLLSLLPIGGHASGITTAGLQYPLRNERLYLGPARGISNVFVTPDPVVRLRSGLLLAVHTRRSRP